MPVAMPNQSLLYPWSMTADGLMIYGVRMATRISKYSRPEWGLSRDIGPAEYEESITTFKQMARKNKFPPVTHNHGGPQIGYVADAWVEGNWLVGDILVTNPDAIAKVMRGELKRRSFEYDGLLNVLEALALLDGQGHFEEEVEDVLLQPSDMALSAKYEGFFERVAASRAKRFAICGSSARPLQGELNMPLDKEALEQVNTLIANANKEAMKAQAQALQEMSNKLVTDITAKMNQAPQTGAPAAVLEMDEVRASIKAANDRAAAAEAKAVELETERTIDQRILAYKAKGGAMTDSQVRAEAKALKSAEAREEFFKRIEAQPMDYAKSDGVVDTDGKRVTAAQCKAEIDAMIRAKVQAGATNVEARIQARNEKPHLFENLARAANQRAHVGA